MTISGMSGMSGTNQMQANRPPQPPQRPSKEDMFSEVDQDSSGSVDSTEFEEMTTRMQEMTGESIDSEELFSTMDVDGDGTLTSTELDDGLTDMHKGMEGLKQRGMMNKPRIDMSQLESSSSETSTDLDLATLLSQTDNQTDIMDLFSQTNDEDETESSYEAVV